MEKFILALHFLVLVPTITFHCVKSETFFIVTAPENCFESGNNESSLGSEHPEDIDGSFDGELPCLTLQQFVERFNNNSYKNLTNITLDLDSGEHSLNSTLSILNITLLTTRSNTTATIFCFQPGIRLQLYSIENIIFSGVTFIGCEEIEVSFANQFRFENSSFQSSPNGSLILNHTMNATVIGGNFTEISKGQCDRAAITIYNSSVLVQYCTFSNSEAGIYSTHSSIAIDSSTFVNNSVVGCDEITSTAFIMMTNGPRTTKRVTITNSDFIDNRKIVTDPDLHIVVHGTSIDSSTLLQNNTFANNSEFDRVLQIVTEYNEVIMDHNDIYNNKIADAVVSIAASNQSITLIGNNFTENYATLSAVLIELINATVAINDSYFYGNQDSGALSIQYYNQIQSPLNASVMIARCTFTHNFLPGFEHKSHDVNGAVSVYMSAVNVPISIIQSTFVDNVALDYDGGAINIETNDSRVVIDSCTFIENKSSGSNGGAVYIKGASSILINRTNFTCNQGRQDSAAALYMEVDNADIAINESHFYDNRNTRIYDSGYYDHAETVHLGGKFNSFVIYRSSFVNNAVEAIDGGMVAAYGSQTGSVVVLCSNFTNNTVTGPPDQFLSEVPYGGLIVSANTVKIADSIFLNNSAENCGAISVQANHVDISNSYFVRNSALQYSGGVMCVFQRLNQLLISNSTFSYNYAKNDGGVFMMNSSATTDIRGSTFDNNRADLQGGVFWIVPLNEGRFNISDSSFISNQAGSDGGVMAMNISDNYRNSLLAISGSTFDQNRAKAQGGVFSSFVPYTHLVDNSSFTSNQAGTDGGVMYVGSHDSHVRISNSSMFSFNHANDKGGVISISGHGSRLEISNTTVFSDNIAGIGDDIIACDCDIESNTAFIQHSYTDPSFPNCIIYGHYQVTSRPPVVALAVSIPIGFIAIVVLLTTIVLVSLCFYRKRRLQKQYGVTRSDHPDSVPLMNDT